MRSRAEFRNRLTNAGIAGRLAILASGTVIGQLITVAALPVTARIYSPDEFDVLGQYTAVILIIATVASLRLELAISLPENDTEANDLLRACIRIAGLTSLLVAVIVGLLAMGIEGWSALGGARLASWALPLGIMSTASYGAVQSWAIRKGLIGAVARAQGLRNLAVAAAQISLGLAGFGVNGLVVGYLAYGSIGLLVLAEARRRSNVADLRLNRTGTVGVIRRWKRFPTFSAPEALFDAGASYAPLLLLSTIGLAGEAGHLLLASRAASIPISLFGSELSRLYLAEGPEQRRSGGLSRFTFGLMKRLAAAGAIPLILAVFFAPRVFAQIFGQEWRRSGTMIAWLAPSMFAQMIVAPVSTAFYVTEQQVIALVFKVAGFGLVAGMMLLSYFTGEERMFEAFAVAQTVYYLIYGVLIWAIVARDQPPGNRILPES